MSIFNFIILKKYLEKIQPNHKFINCIHIRKSDKLVTWGWFGFGLDQIDFVLAIFITITVISDQMLPEILHFICNFIISKFASSKFIQLPIRYDICEKVPNWNSNSHQIEPRYDAYNMLCDIPHGVLNLIYDSSNCSKWKFWSKLGVATNKTKFFECISEFPIHILRQMREI